MKFLRFSFGLGKRSGEDEYANFVPPPEVIPRNSMFGLHKRGVELWRLCREGKLLALDWGDRFR